MKEKILKLLQENARMGMEEIALRSGVSQEDAQKAIADLEKSGVILGYTAIVNDSSKPEKVRSWIQIKVTPTRDGGFDKVAQRIAKFREVKDLFLISGSYDLLLTIEGDSLQEVALFVAEKLSTIEGVNSTSTGFQLKKYKEAGRIMQSSENYERLKICP